MLRRQAADWRINFFKDLRKCNLFNNADLFYEEDLGTVLLTFFRINLHTCSISVKPAQNAAEREHDSPGKKQTFCFFFLMLMLPKLYSLSPPDIQGKSTCPWLLRRTRGTCKLHIAESQHILESQRSCRIVWTIDFPVQSLG